MPLAVPFPVFFIFHKITKISRLSMFLIKIPWRPAELQQIPFNKYLIAPTKP